jgi:hypothetical protein
MSATLAAVRENLAGAIDVMLGRPQGMHRLDLSVGGFWLSFAAIVLVAPLAALGLESQERLNAAMGGCAELLAGDWGIAAIAVLVDWVAFPLVFAVLVRPLGLAARYVPLIVCRNWGSVIISAVSALAHALHVIGLLPSAILPYVLLVIFAVSLRFLYLIVRTALAVPITVALPVVAFDVLLSLTLWSAFERFA